MAMESKEALDTSALPLPTEQIFALDQLTIKKQSLEKEKKTLLEKTFYNPKQLAVKNKKELDKRIQKFEAQQKQAEEDGEEFPAQKLVYLHLCKATAESLANLDKEIQTIDKEMQKSEVSIAYIQANIGVDELSIHEMSAVHVGHEFHAAIADSSVEATTHVGTINAPNSHLHVGPISNVYQTTPRRSSPNYKNILQRLKKSLCVYYQQYMNLEHLFDERETPISDSFINLALIKETEYKVKEQSLARGGLEEKDDDSAREKLRGYVDERMASHEQLYAVKEPLALTELFEPKDDTQTPNKILILGRAGIGKSILCQYLATQWASDATGFAADAKDEEIKEISVTDYLQQKFDVVFWLKLREIAAKITKRDALTDVINLFCLGKIEKDKPTAEELRNYIKNHSDKILFILDGYDEIINRIDQPEYRHVNRILAEIASHQHLLLTSRPIIIDTLGGQPIQFDRRLENMGFLNENIEAYVHQFMQTAQKPKQATQMLNFLKTYPSVWGIAHIPINLELLSWLWSEGKLDFEKKQIITLSALYQTILDHVQEAYTRKTPKRPFALDLNDYMANKRENGQRNTVADRVNEFLEHLAYSAMETETLFIPASQIKIVLKKTLTENGCSSEKYDQEQLLKSATDKLGFLRVAGQSGGWQLDEDHYFIHLSFQEFYAAKYITRILSEHPHSEEGEHVFECILNEKYTPRYQLMLWMSAGLLYQQGKNSKHQQFSPLLRFWRAILSQPRDMIGYHHIVLVMHCLDECEADDRLDLHQALIAQQWACFKFYAKNWYQKSAWYLRGFDWNHNHKLYYRQLAQCSVLCTSASMLTHLLEASREAGDDGWMRRDAVYALSQVSNPSEAIIAALSALQDKDYYVKSIAANALKKLNNLNNPSATVIKALLNALRDGDYSAKSAAADASKKLNNLNNPSVAVIEALLSALRDGDWKVRNIAGFTLGQLSNPSAAVIEVLLSALREGDYSVKSVVTDALNKLNNPNVGVIEALLSALRDGDSKVRDAAASALGQLNSLSEAAIKTLLSALRNRDENIRARSAAARTLGQLHNPSEGVIEALLSALQDESVRVKSDAAEALGKLNNLSEAVIEVLFSALRNGDYYYVEPVATRTLGQLHNPSEAVIEALLSALQDDNKNVRQVAASALSQLNNPSEAVIEALLNTLRGGDWNIRSVDVIRALGKLPNPSEAVIETLLSVLQDENKDVRQAAAGVLSQLISPSEAVIEALLNALRDENKDVRQAAASALSQLNNPSKTVVEALSSALRDGDWNVRSVDTIRGLSKLPNPSEVVIEAFLSALRDENKDVRQAVAEALGQLNHPTEAVIKALLSTLRDRDTDVRRTAALALSKLPNPSQAVVQALQGASRGGECNVKSVDAARALGKLPNPSEALLSALRDKNKEVREAAVEALGQLNHLSEAVIEVLLHIALRDEEKDVREVAVHALSAPNTIQARKLIFQRFMEDEQGSAMYFSHWFEENYLLLIDHRKGNIIARQECQTYVIPLLSDDLVRLEKQVIFVAQQKTYPSEFYNLSGSSDHAEKSVLQSSKLSASMCFISDALWLVYLVRKKNGQCAFLVIEGIASEKHFVECYEFTLSQRGSNPSSGFFLPGSGIGRVLKTKNFLDLLDKDKKDYQCKAWDIDPATGRGLLQLLEAEALVSKLQRHDCLAWAEEKLTGIGLPVEGHWADFTIVLPVSVAKKVEAPVPVLVEENKHCRLM